MTSTPPTPPTLTRQRRRTASLQPKPRVKRRVNVLRPPPDLATLDAQTVHTELASLLPRLSDQQIRFAALRANNLDISTICDLLGISRTAYYRDWESYHALIDRVAYLMSVNITLSDVTRSTIARELLHRASLEAIEELRRELTGDDPMLRHRAAVEILDRTLGRAVQPIAADVRVQHDMTEMLSRVWGETQQVAQQDQIIDAVDCNSTTIHNS